MRTFADNYDFDRQRFLKFGLVGATGIVVNLLAMAAIMDLWGWKDWRSSVLASLVATVNNYLWNNFWTFRDRLHSGKTLITGYGRFLVASIGGLAVTTGVFAILHKVARIYLVQAGHSAMLPSWSLLAFQGLAILFGAYSNYRLNHLITWRAHPTVPTLPPIAESDDEELVTVGASSRSK